MIILLTHTRKIKYVYKKNHTLTKSFKLKSWKTTCHKKPSKKVKKKIRKLMTYEHITVCVDSYI